MRNRDLFCGVLLYSSVFIAVRQASQEEVTEPDDSNMEIEFVPDPKDYYTTTRAPIVFEPTLVSAAICEDVKATIMCPDPDKVLKIIYALYGRRAAFMCNHPADKDCYNESNSTAVISDKCDGKNSCEIHASNDVFGDPCPNIYKYVDMVYTCRPKDHRDNPYRTYDD